MILIISLLLNIVLITIYALSRVRDPHPSMPNDRLLFLRRKFEEFRSLEQNETWELFDYITKTMR